MTSLSLIIAPNPIFKQKSAPVAQVTDATRRLMDDMMAMLATEHAVGMAASMVGILQRIVVIDLTEGEENHKLFMVNPEIIEKSDEKQTFMEASICFPAASADITRPKNIKVKYLDYDGKPQELAATGFLSTCIQHEIDYLDGKVFLDYLSPLKRDMQMKKVAKYKKRGHVHGDECGAGCGN